MIIIKPVKKSLRKQKLKTLHYQWPIPHANVKIPVPVKIVNLEHFQHVIIEVTIPYSDDLTTLYISKKQLEMRVPE